MQPCSPLPLSHPHSLSPVRIVFSSMVFGALEMQNRGLGSETKDGMVKLEMRAKERESSVGWGDERSLKLGYKVGAFVNTEGCRNWILGRASLAQLLNPYNAT